MSLYHPSICWFSSRSTKKFLFSDIMYACATLVQGDRPSSQNTYDDLGTQGICSPSVIYCSSSCYIHKNRKLSPSTIQSCILLINKISYINLPKCQWMRWTMKKGSKSLLEALSMLSMLQILKRLLTGTFIILLWRIEMSRHPGIISLHWHTVLKIISFLGGFAPNNITMNRILRYANDTE